MNSPELLGQILDGKYSIERELGQGGMGTVYLATHLGTERPVAVKIISPQFMQRTEFVERFRREARAAGRLRHPNVVNVTDFGFSSTEAGQVAYLVMEYLDGCTLGEILDEEKNLPLSWTLDIIDQVSSAVQQAHDVGIIHRDLKPDNIWLEPNQRGGYTVKVLDFGIAKLEEIAGDDRFSGAGEPYSVSNTVAGAANPTLDQLRGTSSMSGPDTRISNADTIVSKKAIGHPEDTATLPLLPLTSENETAIFSITPANDCDSVGTKLMSDEISLRDNSAVPTDNASANAESFSGVELTRVGAVLGTPLYMSPEQCRGEHLGPQSDIYSIGVIAYQMLSGAPPFSGDFRSVMDAHQFAEPPPVKAKGVRRKLKKTILAALAKDPDHRPRTAEAFASQLRARSEGILGLLRRALVIYSEHLPKFLMITAFFSIPIIVLTFGLLVLSFLRVSSAINDQTGSVLVGIISFALSIASAFCTSLLVGTISWVVTQYLAVPLRPIRLRPALQETRRKWKRFAGSAVLTAILPFVAAIVAAICGFMLLGLMMLLLYPLTGSVWPAIVSGLAGAGIFGVLGFLGAYTVWILVPPVIMMENVGIREALRRSRELVSRSVMTAAGAVFIMFLIPAIVAGAISAFINISGKAFDPSPEKTEAAVQFEGATETPATPPAGSTSDNKWKWRLGGSGTAVTTGEEKDMRTRVKHTVLESLIQILWLPMQLLVFSFSAIIVALLYLKTRLAGGDSMNELIERFEDDGRPRKKWQERVRQRLIKSGRVPSRP